VLAFLLAPFGALASAGTSGKSEDADTKWFGAGAESAHDARRAVHGLLAPLPGIAISPSLAIASLTGVALLCRESGFVRSRGVCNTPLLVELDRYASLPLAGGLLAFALLCFAANTGKLQGILGKGLKLAEMFATVIVYFLFANSMVGTSGGGGPVKADLLAVTGGVFLAFAAASALMTAMVARLACELLIWLSPFPFVDLALEIVERVVAVGLLLLFLVSPAAAAVVSAVFLLVSFVLLRWAVRMLRFVALVIVRPLAAFVFAHREPPLVDDGLLPRAMRERLPRVAIEAVALAVPGVPARSVGVLIATDAGAAFAIEAIGRRRREVPLTGVRLELSRYLWWFELQAFDAANQVIARLALPLDTAPMQDALRSALGARDAGARGAATFLYKFFPDRPLSPQV
jgi:hypothetical protein